MHLATHFRILTYAVLASSCKKDNKIAATSADNVVSAQDAGRGEEEKLLLPTWSTLPPLRMLRYQAALP